MDKAPRLTAELREDLVAYLDGELDEGDTQKIDHLLTRNEVARHEVEALSRTWEMLDVLPQAKASSSFTEKTLASIRLENLPRAPISEQPWFARLRRGCVALAWVTGLGAAAAVGFVATNRWVPDRQRELLEDLPLVRKLDQYQEVGSVAFLKELRASGLFETTEAAGGTP